MRIEPKYNLWIIDSKDLAFEMCIIRYNDIINKRVNPETDVLRIEYGEICKDHGEIVLCCTFPQGTMEIKLRAAHAPGRGWGGQGLGGGPGSSVESGSFQNVFVDIHDTTLSAL